VSCYDAADQTITRTLPGACAGEIVDDRRRAEIEAERASHVRQALARIPRPPHAGFRSFASGTGFFVAADGAIVTDRHVVVSCGAITAQPPGGAERSVQLAAADPPHDLALLRGAGEPPAVASLDPSPGDSPAIDLLLVGYPDKAVEPSASPVFLQATQLAGAADQYLFHADVRHGHSGGPILDRTGRVIGVARAMVDTARTYRATGLVITQTGLAISSRSLRAFLDANGVRYQTAIAAAAPSADRLARARHFLVHVRCWH
jgi:S1-C subfamily serine protease